MSNSKEKNEDLWAPLIKAEEENNATIVASYHSEKVAKNAVKEDNLSFAGVTVEDKNSSSSKKQDLNQVCP